MLTPGPLTKIYLAAGATDLRAGFEKLTILAQALFAQSPTCGHYFLFCNASRTRLKVLCWDGSGLWLCVNSHAPQCAFWFIFQNSLSISSALRQRLRNLRLRWR
jgi:transposase